MLRVFRYLDTNHDGVILFEEFCSLSEDKWNNINSSAFVSS
jgi:hypothetical protein